MSLLTLLGLFVVTGGATMMGSLPVFFHHYFKETQLDWWESFGGGVMVSASLFSLFLPSLKLLNEGDASYSPFFNGIIFGVTFIFFMAFLIKKVTENVLHQRAFLFVFVMGLHNIPEGLAVGVDVAGVGWRESLPLTLAIFIQNLPEGLATAMVFFAAGFSARRAFGANAITAVIEMLSAILGFTLVAKAGLGLAFLLAFSGACMMSVVAREIYQKFKAASAARFSYPGFGIGLLVCAVLDLIL